MDFLSEFIGADISRSLAIVLASFAFGILVVVIFGGIKALLLRAGIGLGWLRRILRHGAINLVTLVALVITGQILVNSLSILPIEQDIISIMISAIHQVVFVLCAFELAQLVKWFTGLEHSDIPAPILKTIDKIGRGAIYIVSAVLILQSLGVGTQALQVGLVIISLGLVFAARNILSSFIAFLIISLDNTYRVGDTITINGIEGTISQITPLHIIVEGFQERTVVPHSYIHTIPFGIKEVNNSGET